ncbi:NAD(P)-dependent oxidoreductase [Mesorhizobium sp. NZP2234]|jgi:3-hydroxyisobutyrate dehydrogenase|uniref:NAD(P)-dependent oxidoreductase n=1 Tax=Mesorhizobium sp. NZP2234 TaxID=2483402 RepID=UPI0015558E06|nr:NAD(P)-dependent oxidoreductase [Mesorhizobium sp. NZP2234]QKC91921.1 NAD(P)-dependent oxidoreductase [Mesorhizobium sp. NZP2234]
MAEVQKPVVAFIGLGMMGLPMAKNLLKAGHDVVATDLSAGARADFDHAGGQSVENIADLASSADLVITMLPNGRIVREVLIGDAGIAAGLRAGTPIIDMSSSAPFETRELADDLKTLGLRLVDAPVSGGVRRAVDGTLAIMVGGVEEDIEIVMPVLNVMGKSITVTGAVGSGHAMKALNNYVSAAGLQAACEALLIGQEFGIEPDVLVDVLNVSTGRNNSTELKLKPFIIREDFASGFSMALMAKDIETAAELARRLGRPEPGLEGAAALWKASLARLGKSADHTEIYNHLKTERSRR